MSSMSPESSMAGVSKEKSKRSTRACDRCYRKACKCSPGIEGTTCARCAEEGVPCSYNRQVKRRGPQSRRTREAAEGASSIIVEPSVPEPSLVVPCSPPRAAPEATHVVRDRTLQQSSVYDEDIVKPELIERLVQNFYRSSYPTRPYFHWPTYQAQIQSQVYRSDWGIFVVTMAICAMSAATLSNGLTVPSDFTLDQAEAAAISSRCYAAAVKAFPQDYTTVADYVQMMKASAILASVCLQKGDLKRSLSHLGDYVSLSVVNGFYNETNWPSNLTEIQRQERRRLFWGVYQQEQYVSNDFGLISRQREAQASVRYAAEVFCDEDITETTVRLRPDRVSFLRGWNFCTDLYRLLENINNSTRTRQQVSAEDPDSAIHSFLARFAPPKHFAPDSLHFIEKLYADLPPELTQVKAMTDNPESDRYAIIACNILITSQVLKMLLVGTGESSVHQRCAIASELLDELSSVPLAFFHATSISSLRHLAHVGHMLASVIQSPLSAWTYLQVRSILRVLADFLERIESARASAPHLSVKLRMQIDRIDQCMKRSSEQYQEPGLRSVGQILLLGWQRPPDSPISTNVQNSPPQSVESGAQPPDIGGPHPFNAMHQNAPAAARTDSRNAFSMPQQQSLFQDPTFDFMLQADNPTFSLDPLENWPLSLGGTGLF